MKENRTCVICYDNDRSIGLLPCGHLCICGVCSGSITKCPMCRVKVKGVVNIKYPEDFKP